MSAIVACKDRSAQKSFAPPAHDAAAVVAAASVDAAVDPAYAAELDRRLAACVAKDLIRTVDSTKITGMFGLVMDAWRAAPPETARAGIAAIVDAAADLRRADARVRLYARAGVAYLALAQREPALDAFTRAITEAASATPEYPGALDDALDDSVEGLARLGQHDAVDQALVARPAAAAAASIGYSRAGDRANAESKLATALALPRDRAGSRPRLATALVLVERAAAARALWADAKPAIAARDAIALAEAVVDHAVPEALTFIDDAETAVSRANDLESHMRVQYGLALAALRQRAGDAEGADRRRAALAAQISTLGGWNQMKYRPALAELALEAGDVATAEHLLDASPEKDHLAQVAMILPRVRIAIARGDLAAASEPLYTEALAPTALGYTYIVGAYRKRGVTDGATEQLLMKRVCP